MAQLAALAGTLILTGAAMAAQREKAVERLLAGDFRWTVGAPLVEPVQRPGVKNRGVPGTGQY